MNDPYTTPSLPGSAHHKACGSAARLVASHAVEIKLAVHRPLTTAQTAQCALINAVAGERIIALDRTSFNVVGAIRQGGDCGLRGGLAWQSARCNLRLRAGQTIGQRQWYGITDGVAKQPAVALAISLMCALYPGDLRDSRALVVELLPNAGQFLSKVLGCHDFAGAAVVRLFQTLPLRISR